jgi:cytochrome bd-type quinol oxidase subunit 2
MFTKLRKSLITLIASVVVMATPFASFAVASAADGTTDIQACVSQGVGLSTAGNGSSCTPSDTQGGSNKVQSIVTTAVNIFSIVVGIIAVIMIIVAGAKFIVSRGESGNVTGARNTITTAVIGLIIVALAQIVVQFVLDKVSSSGNS